jgi:polyhydroxyalkanoate synthesis regulator phasin
MMGDGESNGLDPERLSRIAGQADKLVAAGRLTADEAHQLRAAPDAARAEQVLREIRARHASERLDAAVSEGAMRRREADDLLERVRGGEHSRALRSHLSRFRVKRRERPEKAEPGALFEENGERPV